MAQLLLTYNLKTGVSAGLYSICRSLGIRVREVDPREYGLPIGALAGIPIKGGASPSETPAPPFDDEMLVMCHMISTELDAFLQAMRNQGLPRIALKAVLTLLMLLEMVLIVAAKMAAMSRPAMPAGIWLIMK